MASSVPFDQCNVFTSRDPDSVRDYVSGLFCQHRLGLADKAADINAHLNHMQMIDLSFVYLDYGAAVSIQPDALQDFYLLQTVLEGSASVIDGKNIYTARAGEATLINPNRPIEINSSADCRFLSIRLNKCLVDQQLSMALHDAPSSSLVFEPDMNFHTPEGNAIHRYIRFLINEMNLLCDQSQATITYRHFEQTLAAMLIELHRHNFSRRLYGITSGAAKPCVKKAEQFMLENLGLPITLGHLALAAQTTPRTLRNAFQRSYGTSPMHYLKSLRLERARQLLSSSPAGANITRIAMDCGITHLGRFAKEYKERFGETPSQTIKQTH